MPLVLAIEPDMRQAAIVKRVIKEKVQADVAVVDSRDAAIAAIRARVPDVLLLSALLSPRDEQELMGHLRTLDNAAHLQTHTLPQLASSLQPSEDDKGLLKRLRRKKGAPVATQGCDPDVFADEVREFLRRAEEKKRERELFPQPSIVTELKAAPPTEDAPVQSAAAAGSSWDSPFEWPSGSRDAAVSTPAPSPAHAESLIASSESLVGDSGPLLGRAESSIAPDPSIRHSDLSFGNPVSSIRDRVEFPRAASTAPVPRPDPPPDNLAAFITFDRARGLRRDAIRWLRTDAPRPARGARLTLRDIALAGEDLAMGDPVRVRIRSIRVRPAA